MGLSTGQTATQADFFGSSGYVQVFSATGTTLSITTIANQKVVVMVSGLQDSAGGTNPTISLLYDGVTKHSIVNGQGNNTPFSLMYSESPGAGTKNITVTTSAGSLSNVVITAFLVRTA